MYITDGHDIKIPGGDTAAIPFVLYTEDEGGETPYLLPPGQYAELAVRPVKGAAAVLIKTADRSAQSPDGAVTITFGASETNIAKGRYIYTVSLKNTGGTAVDTWHGAEPSAFFEIL